MTRLNSWEVSLMKESVVLRLGIYLTFTQMNLSLETNNSEFLPGIKLKEWAFLLEISC